MESVDSTTLPKQDIILKYILLLAFFISGFSGLIYESIWTHYLKLFLGHSAYAQTLVLSIFMGGMALGAWLASKYLHKINNYFLAYAIIEAIIGVAALSFHSIYVLITDFSYNTAFQWFENKASIELYKWILSSILILPQTVLLGSTFPLMSTGFVQCFPKSKGYSLSILYFSNSFGAAIGVLISGFVLINLVGLPGTLLTAGLLNFLVALLSWAVSKMLITESIEPPHLSSNESASHHLLKIMLIVAAFTGAASFMYEIAWVRMLSMVLGSSVHSFELMLSAFILGLAIGGFWIRNKLHKLKNPIKTLANIQIIMGLLSASTIIFYNQIFDLMAFTLQALNRTEEGYIYFNLISHSICLVVMLPATICAGMTLPLITYLLLEKGYNARSIGWVYSANTVGSIIGVIIASQIIMPILGLAQLVIIGSKTDIILGLLLLYYFEKKSFFQFSSLLIIPWIFLYFFKFDTVRMASGVYRTGKLYHQNEVNIEYIEHGKTATVIVTDVINKKNKPELKIISTNGKPDAGIASLEYPATGDEETTILLALIPISLSKSINNIAVIGMGSGITSHVLLSNPIIKRVDTIDIEPAMINGAKLFNTRNKLVFSDKRSFIHKADARTYFHSTKHSYDIIISEPSNPWISGVASLFTTEFYQSIKKSLKKEGIFAQWIHLYEFDISLLISILSAIENNFKHYIIFATNNADLLIISSDKEFTTKDINLKNITQKTINEITRINHKNKDDIASHYITKKEKINFLTKNIQPNSDYYPIVQQKADKYRFLSTSADSIFEAATNYLIAEKTIDISPSKGNSFFIAKKIKYAKKALNEIKESKIYITSKSLKLCKNPPLKKELTSDIYQMFYNLYLYTNPKSLTQLLSSLNPSHCNNKELNYIFETLIAIIKKDHTKIISNISYLRKNGSVYFEPEFLSLQYITSLLKTSQYKKAHKEIANFNNLRSKIVPLYISTKLHP